MHRYLTLWRRPHIFWEPGMIRWPGMLEISWSLRRGFGLALELINTQDDEERWPWAVYLHLVVIELFLHLPGPLRAIVDGNGRRCHGEWASWGFRFAEDIVFAWGYDRSLRLRWPWSWVYARHEVQLPGGEWVMVESARQQRSWELRRAIIDQAERWQFPYRYALCSGEVQNRTATVFVERRYWRRHWLRWLPAFEKCSTAIDVTFSEEIGEQSDSWKGGCTGCGYDMRPGETAEQTLRRMEAERKF